MTHESKPVVEGKNEEIARRLSYMATCSCYGECRCSYQEGAIKEALDQKDAEKAEIQEALEWFIEWAIKDKEVKATPDKAAWFVKCLEMGRIRKQEMTDLQSKLDEAVKGLEFYAKKGNWKPLADDEGNPILSSMNIMGDIGDKARETLAKVKEK